MAGGSARAASGGGGGDVCAGCDRAGPLGLYRGLTSLLYFSVPKVATRFFAYEMLANQLQDASGKMTVLQTMGCGLGAGVAEAIVAGA